MKHRPTLRLALLSVALGFLAMPGCGKKSDTAQDQTQTPNANNVAQQMTNAMGGNGAAHKSAVHAVPSTTLSGLLPDVGGFTAHDPSTSSANFNGIEWSVASREFDNGPKHIKITLADYNYAEGLTAAYTMLANYSMEDENQIQHGEKFGDYPGWIEWHKKSNDGQIGVIVKDRIYLVVEGSGGVTLDDLRAVVGKINLDGVARAAS